MRRTETWTSSLMDSSVFVIIINPEDYTYTDTLTSACEIKARGAKVIGTSNKQVIYTTIGYKFQQ